MRLSSVILEARVHDFVGKLSGFAFGADTLQPNVSAFDANEGKRIVVADPFQNSARKFAGEVKCRRVRRFLSFIRLEDYVPRPRGCLHNYLPGNSTSRAYSEGSHGRNVVERSRVGQCFSFFLWSFFGQPQCSQRLLICRSVILVLLRRARLRPAGTLARAARSLGGPAEH